MVTLLDSVGSEGTGPLQFDNPGSIAFNASNNKLYVTDDTSRIQVLNSNLTLHNTFDCIGPSLLKFITCDKTGLVYVCKHFGNSIEILTAEGHHKKTITMSESEWRLRGIAVDDDGYIYVANYHNQSIGVYASSGQLVKTFGGQGSWSRTVRLPLWTSSRHLWSIVCV